MKHFLLGAALGVVATAAVGLWINYEPHGKDERWALPTFMYFELDGGDFVSITGTLNGSDVGYKMNTYQIRCTKSDGECRIADVEEIGFRQLGEISIDEWPVTSWNDTTIVAQSADTTSCNRVVLTINRPAKLVTYTRIPQNVKATYCRVFKATKSLIGRSDSPGSLGKRPKAARTLKSMVISKWDCSCRLSRTGQSAG